MAQHVMIETISASEVFASKEGLSYETFFAGKEESDQDLRDYLQKARDNFIKYLECIPQQELQQARNYVKATAR